MDHFYDSVVYIFYVNASIYQREVLWRETCEVCEMMNTMHYAVSNTNGNLCICSQILHIVTLFSLLSEAVMLPSLLLGTALYQINFTTGSNMSGAFIYARQQLTVYHTW